MRHKMTYLFTLLALSSSAYAANSGFYVGVDTGSDESTVKLHSQASSPTTNVNTSTALDGFLGGVHGGYNVFLTKQFVLGGELFWNYSNANTTTQDTQGAEGYRRLEVKNSVGASLLPGWQVNNNNRLYARLGWILTQLTNDTTLQSTGYYGPSFNNYRNGLEVGLGYLYSWAQRWDIRMEYDHADYRTLNKSFSAAGDTGNYAYKLGSDRFMLGLNYNFGNEQDNSFADMHNWYVGVAAGRDNATQDYTIVGITHGDEIQQNNQSLRGYLGELHLGHDWQLGTYTVIGAEIFGSVNSANDTTGNSTVNGKWREKNSEGLALLPGIQLAAANRLYARFGYIASKFSAIGAQGPNFNTTKPGLQLGLGYAVALTNTWNVFGEYDHAKYASIHTASAGNHYYMSPTDNQYKFGVNYHF